MVGAWSVVTQFVFELPYLRNVFNLTVKKLMVTRGSKIRATPIEIHAHKMVQTRSVIVRQPPHQSMGTVRPPHGHSEFGAQELAGTGTSNSSLRSWQMITPIATTTDRAHSAITSEV